MNTVEKNMYSIVSTVYSYCCNYLKSICVLLLIFTYSATVVTVFAFVPFYVFALPQLEATMTFSVRAPMLEA